MISFKMFQIDGKPTKSLRRYKSPSRLFDVSRVLNSLLSFILKASRKNLRKNFPENVPKYLLEKACMEKSPEDMSLLELFDFSELLRSRRFHFPLKNYMDRCFCLNLGEHFVWYFFPLSFFVWARRKYTGKNPHKNSVNENSSKVRRNTCPQ